MMKKIIRQPLVHFLVIGVLIFLADAARDAPDDPQEQVINVSASRINALAKTWEARRMQPPSPAELQDLIDGYVREEILYREAKQLGLDRDDTVIRRRLAQKMEFLYQDLQTAGEPEDEALQAYYEKYEERYREPVRLSFRQFYFSTDRRGARAMASARTALVSLRNGQEGNEGTLGDPSMLEHEYRNLSRQEIRDRFGEEFAAELTGLPTGHWYGPVRSAYGLHVVQIERRSDGRQPALDEVRRRVLRDYMHKQEEMSDRAFYQRLRRNYSVNIENSDLIASDTLPEGG